MSDQSQANTGTKRALPELNSHEEEEAQEQSSLLSDGELATGRSAKRIRIDRGLSPWCTPCSPLNPTADGCMVPWCCCTPRSPLHAMGGTHSRDNNNDCFNSESDSIPAARCNPAVRHNPGAQSTITAEEISPLDDQSTLMHPASSFRSDLPFEPCSLLPAVPPTSLGLTTQDSMEESCSLQDSVQASNNGTPEELVCPKVRVASPDDLVCPFIHFFRDQNYQ